MNGSRLESTLVEARFWRNVDVRRRDECWPWKGGTHSGYGVFHPTKHSTVRAPRFALSLALGRELAKSAFACHRCDNPPCVNPAHLFEGSNDENMADMVAKQRQARGSMKSRFTEDDVLAMRQRAAAGEQLSAIAADVRASPSLISMIVRGQRWKHVGGPITHSYRKAS